MADKKKYFNVDEFQNWKKTHGKNPLVPPRANFLAAANYIRDLFEKNKFAWGIMGGMEMLCLGYRREMPDLHIAYDYRDFTHMKTRLVAERRVRLQDGMNPLFSTKILVETGPDYKDAGCTQTTFVEVDLVPPGICGTPPIDTLSSNLVLLNLNTNGKQKTYKGLNMLYLMNTLVHYCKVRGLAWDPKKDIVFLCQNYGEDVQHINSKLNQKEIQEHFLGTPFFSRLPFEDQRRCYLIILGREPPPTMAITPPVVSPGHKYSASASDSTRPRISSHKSSPSLNTHVTSEHLSLPIPGQSHLHVPSAPQSHTKPENSATARDSRTRYRTVSAPNGCNNILGGSQTRPKSMDLRLPQQEPALPSYQARITNMQSVVSSKPQLQVVSSFCPVPMVAEARKSMPNLNTSFAGPVAPYAFTQTPYTQQSLSTRPVSMSGAPGTQNPGQHHLKSQLGLTRDEGHGKMGPPVPITVNPKRPQARASSYGSHLDTLAHIGKPIPEFSEPKLNQLHLVGPEEISTPSALVANESNEPPISKLHLVDNEGLYAAPYRSDLNDHSEDEASLHPPPLFASKGSPSSVPQSTSFVAELSADEKTTFQPTPLLPSSSHKLSESLIFPQKDIEPAIEDAKTGAEPVAEDTPINPPDTSTPAATKRPSHPRAQSAPLNTLPASLIAGGVQPHPRPPRTSISAPLSTPPTQTNLSKYTHYYANSSNNPYSQHPTQIQSNPESQPQPTYKAYQLPSPPLPQSTPATNTTQHPHPNDQPTNPLPASPNHARDAEREAISYLGTDEQPRENHKRTISHESVQSQSSDQLAREYRLEVLEFKDFFGDEDK